MIYCIGNFELVNENVINIGMNSWVILELSVDVSCNNKLCFKMCMWIIAKMFFNAARHF